MFFIHKKIFLRGFDWKSLQTLHVSAKTPYWPLWPKSSEKKEDFDFKSDFIKHNELKKKNSRQFQYKEGLYVFGAYFVFFSKVQGV